MGRWWIGVALAAGAAGMVVVVARDDLAGFAATRAVRASGFPDAAVAVHRFGLDGLDASLRLGADTGVDEAKVGWSASGLLAGRLDALALRGARLRLRLLDDGSLTLAGHEPPPHEADAPADGRAGLPDLPVGAVTVEDAAVTVETSAGSLSQPFRLTAARTGGEFAGRLELPAAGQDLAALAPVIGDTAAGRVSVSGAIGFSLVDGALRATPDGCLMLNAEGLTLAGQAVTLPDGLCLRAAGEKAVMAEWAPAAETALALRAIAGAARLGAPAAAVEARNLVVALTVSKARAELAADASLRHTGRPAAIAPVALSAKAVWSAGQPATFTAIGTGPFRLEAEGTHDPASGTGRVDLRLPKLAFAEDGTVLAKAFPMLAGTVSATAGGVAARARLAWEEGALTSSGEVLLDGVAASVGPVTVAGVNGTVRLSSLLPPVAPPGQTVAVKLLDVGIPLTDGTLRFGYGRDGRVSVERADWRWAGGVLRAKPFALSPRSPKGLVELEAEGIDFGQLLALAAVDGLDATGRLRGRLPVRIDGGTVRIDDGVLEASAPGAVRYDPETPPSFLEGDPGSATDLLRGALTDFRYKELRLTVNGTAGGELTVGLSLQGANPDFYDGHPVKLNLNLSGALDRILRQSIDAYRIPDAVRERMTEFGQKTP